MRLPRPSMAGEIASFSELAEHNLSNSTLRRSVLAREQKYPFHALWRVEKPELQFLSGKG